MKNCCTDSGPAPRKISTDELGRTLQAKTAGADTARVAQLGGLQTLRQTKSASLAREQTRLSARLGAQHPRVLALSQKIAVNRNLSVQLQRARARAQASVFQADPHAWIVHGHVRTADSGPVPQATVALYTCEGQWQRQFGYACTDANGYFKLTIAKSAASAGGNAPSTAGAGAQATGSSVPPAQPDVGVKSTDQPGATGGAAPPSSNVDTAPSSGGTAQPDVKILQTNLALEGATSAVDTTASGRKLCLNATDANQRFLGGADGPLTPRPGAVDYREIIVDKAAGACTPPGSASGAAPGTIEKTRFLGNSHTREVHDLQNAKKNCRIEQVLAYRHVYFKTVEDAVKAGFDYCAYCFGKAKSKR